MTSNPMVVDWAQPNKVCFWTGAGVSNDPPTTLPLGSELTKRSIRMFCVDGTLDKIARYFCRTNMRDAYGREKRLPRLEVVLESLYDTLGPCVFSVLEGFDVAPPNPLHCFFAQHLRRGGAHITANFDSCIERALPPERSPNILTPLHIHQLYSPDEEQIRRLGARIQQVAAGFPPDLSQRLTVFLERSSVLVFTGYSGSDYFDVDPFFESLTRANTRFESLQVLWINHDESRSLPEYVDWREQTEGKRILEALERCGAKITYVIVATRAFLESIAELWEFPWMHPSLDSQEPRPRCGDSLHPITQVERSLATGHLYGKMGIGREAAEIAQGLLADLALAERGLRIQSQTLFLAWRSSQDTGLYRRAQALELSHTR